MTDGARSQDQILDRAALTEQLLRHPILRPLGHAALEGVLAYAQLRTLRTRARLFSAGDAGNALYLVLSGWIKISRPGETGRDIVLDLAGPGSVFGELAVLCAMPRAADAVALGPARLVAIDGRALIAALRASPDALLAVIRLLGERLARTTAQVAEAAMPAEARVARALLRLAAMDPRPEKAGMAIELGLSQGDLGELTGLARESVNKLLAGWRDAGIVSLSGRTVVIRDMPGLQAVAEF